MVRPPPLGRRHLTTQIPLENAQNSHGINGLTWLSPVAYHAMLKPSQSRVLFPSIREAAMSGAVTKLIASSAGVFLTLGGVSVSAQAPQRPVLTIQEASMRTGIVSGTVRDDAGQGVAGVAVSAIGTIQAQVRTDATGGFRLPLVPGDYILRAARDGYVSPYRESVRIRASSHIERNIVITRQLDLKERKVLLASTGLTTGDAPLVPSLEDAVTTRTATVLERVQAWYLRYLPRTVLRDGVQGAGGNRSSEFAGHSSFFDRAVLGSARAASAYFLDADFSGQVNLLTTSAVSAAAGRLDLPRGVAYLAVGAPVGTHGDWRVRGALSAGGLASWVALAEYEARDVRSHAFRVGMSYGAQRLADTAGAAMLMSGTTRNAGSVYGIDRWRVRPGLELEYGLRADHYDYVQGRGFLSPRVGVRVGILTRTFVTASGYRAVVAPGVDEFLPPSSAGTWLPPERTFSSLVPSADFRPERVLRWEAGLEREFGPIGQTRSVAVRRFHESTRDQLTTMFGVGGGSRVGHYYVGTAGDVALSGWSLKISGQFANRIRASVDYSISQARWVHGTQAGAIRATMPSAIRPASERLHDITSTLQATVPETKTWVSVAYRMNTAFARPDAFGIEPILDGRFDIQLRQALPIQPLTGGTVEVLVAVNNLFRDPSSGVSFGSSFYDELLTVRTPRRVMGGVQVRF